MKTQVSSSSNILLNINMNVNIHTQILCQGKKIIEKKNTLEKRARTHTKRNNDCEAEQRTNERTQRYEKEKKNERKRAQSVQPLRSLKYNKVVIIFTFLMKNFFKCLMGQRTNMYRVHNITK